MSADLAEPEIQDLFSWAPFIERDFGHGQRKYRTITLAPRISESVFEYWSEKRNTWRVTRNTNVRLALWKDGHRSVLEPSK